MLARSGGAVPEGDNEYYFVQLVTIGAKPPQNSPKRCFEVHPLMKGARRMIGRYHNVKRLRGIALTTGDKSGS